MKPRVKGCVLGTVIAILSAIVLVGSGSVPGLLRFAAAHGEVRLTAPPVASEIAAPASFSYRNRLIEDAGFIANMVGQRCEALIAA